MAASVLRDEDQEISEWGSSFEDAAKAGSFNITAQNQILEMLRAGRSWAIDDDLLYETRSPRLTWENSPPPPANRQ